MATAAIKFIVADRHVVQVRRHLARVGVGPLSIDAAPIPGPTSHSTTCTVYTSESDRVLDVLFRPGLKSLLIADGDGTLVTEDYA